MTESSILFRIAEQFIDAFTQPHLMLPHHLIMNRAIPKEFPKCKEPYGFEDFGFAKIFMIEKPKEIVEKTEENGSIAGSFTPRGWLKLNKAKILHNLIH